MSKMVRVLKSLGVSFEPPEQVRHYKFQARALMDLVVEQWVDSGRFMMSIAHYGEQNSDLMADPDMLFEVVDGELEPVYYQNDYVAVFDVAREYTDSIVAVNQQMARKLKAFASAWAEEITMHCYAANQSSPPPKLAAYPDELTSKF